MPFTKITSGKDKGKYRSPSGRVYTEAQVRMYYATEGFKKEPKPKKKTSQSRKREQPRRRTPRAKKGR